MSSLEAVKSLVVDYLGRGRTACAGFLSSCKIISPSHAQTKLNQIYYNYQWLQHAVSKLMPSWPWRDLTYLIFPRSSVARERDI